MRGKMKTLLLLATVAAFAGSGGPAVAETIDELKAQLQALTQKVQELEVEQARIKDKTEGITPNKPAVTSGKQGVRLAISGQVNRAVLYADNGDDGEFFHVDNDNSSTRVRFIGTGRFNEDFSVGSVIEVQFESNSTAALRVNQDGPAGPNNFTERKLEVYGDSRRFGRLWVGQGDTASNGTSEQDLSGTGVIAYAGIPDMAGGIAFNGVTGLGPRINQAYSDLDGLSRDDRVRYDTPSWQGFKASASILERGDWDVAGRYRGDINGTKVVTALAFADATSSRRDFSQVNGSVTALFPVGVNVTFAAGLRDREFRDDDATFFYGKLGYLFDPFGLGNTALVVDYGQANDLDRDGDEFRAFGAFIVQNFDRIATEFYAGVRDHQLDRPGEDFDDIIAAISGARVKF